MVSTITQGLMDKTIGTVDFNREKKLYKLIADAWNTIMIILRHGAFRARKAKRQ